MLPVVVVTSLDAAARDRALFHLQLALPGAAVVRHELTPDESGEGGQVRRVVGDWTGVVVDRTQVIDHACLVCTARKDIVPTLADVVADGRWDAIVLALPVAANPEQMLWELHRAVQGGLDVRVACCVAAVDADEVTDDVFGDETLEERGLAVSATDERAVGETVCQQVEYADVVVALDEASGEGWALLQTLAAPEADVVASLEELDAAALLERSHCLTSARARVDVVTCPSPREVATQEIFTLELTSDRAFHPERLNEQLELIGSGELRSRGCFWLPTRPAMVCAWDGSGGQVSIGDAGLWGDRAPRTRLLLTAPSPEVLERARRAFTDCLLTDFEAARAGEWLGREDGFDPWLGVYDLRSA